MARLFLVTGEEEQDHQQHHHHHHHCPAMDVKCTEQLRAVFELCDTDNNGYITVDQLAQLSREQTDNHEDVFQLLQLLDPGGTGKIKFEDFCRGVSSILTGGFDVQNGENLSLGEGADSSSSDQVSYTTYSEYDIADDDLMSQQDGTHCRNSPENFSETDCAIIVQPADSGTGSPVSRHKDLNSMSDGEEKYECYGEQEWECGDENKKNSLGINSTSRNNGKISQNFPKRNTWLRTSLRRSPSEKKRLSSSAQASHLYRSSSFNSGSRRSSSCESDDMIGGDISIEDDVLDLNHKVQVLQQQVTALADSHTNHEEKYSKVKQENATLMARIHTLEEQIREVEIRSEERIQEEQKRFKDLMVRQDREKSLEMESYSLKLHNLEKENYELKEDIQRLRSQVERLKSEKSELQDQLNESEFGLSNLRDENKRLQELSRREREDVTHERAANLQMIDDLTKELHELRQYKAEVGPWARTRTSSMLDLPSRCTELEDQLRHMREENRFLRDNNEELQAQVLNSSIQEGRSLLHSGISSSLAAEFEAMTKDEIMEKLKEQQDVNGKLKTYIDGMLLNILENYPSILEVKSMGK